MLNILSISLTESCVQLMEDYHAHVQVLDMMENLTYHADIQQVSKPQLAQFLNWY